MDALRSPIPVSTPLPAAVLPEISRHKLGATPPTEGFAEPDSHKMPNLLQPMQFGAPVLLLRTAASTIALLFVPARTIMALPSCPLTVLPLIVPLRCGASVLAVKNVALRLIAWAPEHGKPTTWLFVISAVATSFFLTSGLEDGTPPSVDSPTSSELTKKEITAIRQTLAEDENRRRKFSPRFLLLVIDGVQRARLDLTQSCRIRLELEADATLIQFVGGDRQGELLLGTHILGCEDDLAADQSRTYSVVLEGGQKISLALLPTQDNAGTDSRSIVDIEYSETNTARAVWLWWAQIRRKISYSTELERRWNIAPLTSKFALGLLAAALVGLILYIVLKGRPTEQQQLAKEGPPSSVVEQGRPGSSTSPGVTPTEKPQFEPPTGIGPPRSRAQSGGSTRDQSTSAVRSLASVRQIYVESFGDDTFGRAVRQAIIEKLRTASGFVVTDVANDADAAVTGSSRLLARGEVGTGQITVELVNVSGDVIWQARKYRGTAAQIAAQFTKDLLEAIRRGKGKRQK